MKVFFAIISYLGSVSVALAGLVTPTVGEPPVAARASFNTKVLNPDMTDSADQDRTPDNWSTNTPLQTVNAQEGGVTFFWPGGVLSQSLSVGADTSPFNAYWITVTYRTFPYVITGTVYDPGLLFQWAYIDSPGSTRTDFFYVPGNNPANNPAVGFTTLNYWGRLLPGTEPRSITFTASSSPTYGEPAHVEIDVLNFRTGTYKEIPEPSTMLLTLLGGLAMLRARSDFKLKCAAKALN